MTFHQLKIFDAVAEHLNITTASRKIRISQPSVSKQLRLLERECGLKLYVRCGQGIRVTEEGRLFRIAAKPVIEQMEELKRTFLARVAEQRGNSLTVGSTPSPAAFFLSEVLKSFVELHPTVHPTLRTGLPDQIEQMVLNGEVEIALTTVPPEHPEIAAEPIHREDLVAVVSTKHPLARKARLSEDELLHVPFVMTRGGRIAQEIQSLGLKLNVVIWCESVDIKKESVQAGLGVGLFYRGSADAGLKEHYFKIIEIPRLKDTKITCFAIYKKSMELSAVRRDLLDLLRQWSRKANELPRPRVRAEARVR
ncbi:MAG TPA: LysR family transcriptional regulator [Candidatus Binatia bacterium]|jgi:DNA-binding transcriptional LysR family regulator